MSGDPADQEHWQDREPATSMLADACAGIPWNPSVRGVVTHP
jgi:hypothetical protein